MTNDIPYSIVIATRNRPSALRLSIPRMLGQSRPPAQLIIIDSSDDHDETARAARESVGADPVELMIRRGERGLTVQRNASLELIRHSLVFFPDDDSIWHPGVAESILHVYQSDVGRNIAAVCGAEAATPPPDWKAPGNQAYQMRISHRIQQRFATLRAGIEHRYFPDPALLIGRSFWPAASELPSWFAEEDVVPVEWMTGFRMSFRTEVIRQVRFDETLTRYSLFEDIDASLGVCRHGWVVGARKAKIYHYRSPEKRDQGRQLGVQQILNKAYLVAKHTSEGDPARNALRKFAHYKVLQYRMAARNGFTRDRYCGARTAIGEMIALFDEAPVHLPQAYQNALRRCSATPGAKESPARTAG